MNSEAAEQPAQVLTDKNAPEEAEGEPEAFFVCLITHLRRKKREMEVLGTPNKCYRRGLLGIPKEAEFLMRRRWTRLNRVTLFFFTSYSWESFTVILWRDEGTWDCALSKAWRIIKLK